jgi:hypothetical protein
MDDPLDYDIKEKIIKDGSILQEFKNSHYWPVVKDLLESEIRACFRGFVSSTKSVDGKEVPITEDELAEFRNRALGVKAVLEMIDGKISDMQVWIAQQQKESEKDELKVDEIFSYHRNNRHQEVL